MSKNIIDNCIAAVCHNTLYQLDLFQLIGSTLNLNVWS